MLHCMCVPQGSARVIRCLQRNRDKLNGICRAVLFDEEVRVLCLCLCVSQCFDRPDYLLFLRLSLLWGVVFLAASAHHWSPNMR